MAELVLHLGAPKTGTTFIQQILRQSQQELAGVGWSYPDFITTNNHDCVPAAFVPDEDAVTRAYPELATESGRVAMRGQLAREFGARVTDKSKWIITSEGFVLRVHNVASVAAIREFFSEWFSTVRAVVYFRRQDFMAIGLYSEYLRAAGPGEVRSLDWDFVNERGVKHRQLDHLGTYRTWAEGLGTENLTVRPYLESFKAASSLVVADFNDAVGIPLAPDQMFSGNSKSRNKGLSALGAEFTKRIAQERDRVIDDPFEQYADPLTAKVAEAIRPYCYEGPETPTRAILMRFNNAVAEVTAGPPIQLPSDAAERLHQAFDDANRELIDAVGDSVEWQAWLDQPRQAQEAIPTLDEAQIDAYLTELARGWPPAAPQTITSRAKRKLRRIVSRGG